MNLFNCAFLRRSIPLTGTLFLVGFLLTFLLGLTASTDSLLLIGLGYFGFLMTVASVAMLAASFVVAVIAASNERLSTAC